jgi:hypothetical protein
MEYTTEYILGVYGSPDDGEFFPSAIRADEDHMARYDIDAWLNTGRTDHFTVPPILQFMPSHRNR